MAMFHSRAAPQKLGRVPKCLKSGQPKNPGVNWSPIISHHLSYLNAMEKETDTSTFSECHESTNSDNSESESVWVCSFRPSKLSKLVTWKILVEVLLLDPQLRPAVGRAGQIGIMGEALHGAHGEMPGSCSEGHWKVCEASNWLVVTGTCLIFPFLLGMSSSQLTNMFQRGSNHQPANGWSV